MTHVPFAVNAALVLAYLSGFVLGRPRTWQWTVIGLASAAAGGFLAAWGISP